jgi:hypothetical protein
MELGCHQNDNPWHFGRGDREELPEEVATETQSRPVGAGETGFLRAWEAEIAPTGSE